jgi:hypothetical protein
MNTMAFEQGVKYFGRYVVRKGEGKGARQMYAWETSQMFGMLANTQVQIPVE